VRTILLDLVGYVAGESTDNVTIAGSGSKSFTLAEDQPFEVGMTVTADAGSGNDMTGTVASYSSTSLVLTITVSSSNGSGSYSSWDIGGLRTLRISDHGYISKPTDTPAKTHWRPGIKDPGNFSQHLFAAGTTSGASSSGKGDIILANANGEFDFMRKMGFSGRSLQVKTLTSKSNAYSTAVTIFNGSTFGIDYSWKQVTIKMRDRLTELQQKQAQESTFAGTNSGSTGYEGAADEIKGYVKPFAYGGPILEVDPPLLNSSTLIYGLNYDADGDRIAVNSIDAVYDSGLAVTLDTGVGTGGDVADIATLQAATITAGQYATCIAEGVFRLNSSPAGKVTCDFTVGASAAARTPAQIAKSLLEDRAGFTSADYNNASFTQLDTDTSSVVSEIYVDDNRNVLECVAQVLGDVGAGLIVNAAGEFEAVRLKDASGETSLVTFNQNSIITTTDGGVNKISSRDPGEGLPVKETRVNYKRIYTTQDEDALAGAVTDSRAIFLKNEYRTTDPTVNDEVALKHLLAPVRELTTGLTNETDANSMRDYWNTLFSEERDWYVIRDDAETIYEIGDTITLQFDRYGLASGKKYYILGRVFELARPFVEYYVWG